MYTSNSEFDLETRVQITNEIRPYSAYSELNSVLKNDTYKWLLGELDYEDEVAYDGYFWDEANNISRKPKKYINGVLSENYGIKPYKKWNTSTLDYEEVKPSGTYMNIDGVLLPEQDLFLHEIYRYLENVYPDHPDWLELLTHNEIIDAFTNAAAMINYKPNNEFFELVAKNLDNINDAEVEAFKIELRNLTSNSYRRKYYGSLIGYNMFFGGIYENALVFPIIETLTSRNNNVIDSFNELYKLKIRNIDYLAQYNKHVYSEDEMNLNFYYLPGFNNITFEFISENENKNIEMNSITQNNIFNFISIDDSSVSINSKYSYQALAIKLITDNVYVETSNSKLFGYVTSYRNYPKYGSIYKLISAEKFVGIFNEQINTDQLKLKISSLNELHDKDEDDKINNNYYLEVIKEVMDVLHTEKTPLYEEVKASYNPIVANTISLVPEEIKKIYPTFWELNEDGSIKNDESDKKVIDSTSVIEEGLPLNYGDILYTSLTEQDVNPYTVLNYNRGFINVTTLESSSGFLTNEHNEWYIDFYDSNTGKKSSSECYGLLITTSNNKKVLLRGRIDINQYTVDDTNHYHINDFNFYIKQIPDVLTLTEVKEIFKEEYESLVDKITTLENPIIAEHVNFQSPFDIIKPIEDNKYTSPKTTKVFIENIEKAKEDLEDIEEKENIEKLKNLYDELIALFNNNIIDDEKLLINNNNVVNVYRYSLIDNFIENEDDKLFTNKYSINSISFGHVGLLPVDYNEASFKVNKVTTETITSLDNSGSATYTFNYLNASDPIEYKNYRSESSYNFGYSYMNDIDKKYLLENQLYEYKIFNEKRYEVFISGNVEFNTAEEKSNRTINFITDANKRIFDNLSVGDKVYGEGIRDNTYIVQLGNYSAILNNPFPKTGEYRLKVLCPVINNPESVIDDITSYKDRLFKNNSYYCPTFFEKGVYGNRDWPNVSNAPLYANLNKYIFNENVEDFRRYTNNLEYKEDVSTTEDKPNSILKYKKQVFVEYNINKLTKLENRSGSKLNLLNIEWLDYIYNSINQISLASNQINVGFNLTMNTDTSGYTTLINDQFETDPNLKVKFQTNGWDQTTVPAYIQLGTAGANMTSYFKLASDILYPNVYGATLFDDEKVTEDIVTNKYNTGINTSYLQKRGVYSDVDNNIMEDTSIYNTYTNIDNPIFETPLTEYNIKSFLQNDKQFMVVDGLVFEQSFKNITNVFDKDEDKVKAYNKDVIYSPILGNPILSLNVDPTNEDTFMTNSSPIEFEYLGNLTSLTSNIETTTSIKEKYDAGIYSYYTVEDVNNYIKIYCGEENEKPVWKTFKFTCAGLFLTKNLAYATDKNDIAITSLNNYITNDTIEDKNKLNLYTLLSKVQVLGKTDSNHDPHDDEFYYTLFEDGEDTIFNKDKPWKYDNNTNKIYVYLAGTFNEDNSKLELSYNVAFVLNDVYHVRKLNLNKFSAFINVPKELTSITNNEYRLFYGTLSKDILDKLEYFDNGYKPVTITENSKSFNTFASEISSQIQLPRKFITQGSYDIQLIIDPRFIGTGYTIENGEKVEVEYNISKSPVFFDRDNNEFYTTSDTYIVNDKNEYVIDKENQKIFLKFDEQKYFKNVKFVSGVYSLNNEENSDAKYGIVKAASDIDFNVSDLSLSDKILRINEVNLRSVYSSELENIYNSAFSKFYGQIYGFITSDTLYVGPIKSSTRDETNMFAQDLNNLIPIDENEQFVYSNKAKKEVNYSKLNFRPDASELEISYPYNSFGYSKNDEDSIKYFKNLLIVKGKVNSTDSYRIATDNSPEFANACKVLRVGDVMVGAMSFESSIVKQEIIVTPLESTFDGNPTKVGYANGRLIVITDNSTIYYKDINSLDGVTSIEVIKSSKISNNNNVQIIDVKNNSKDWLVSYKEGSINKIADITDLGSIKEAFTLAQNDSVNKLPEKISIETGLDSFGYVNKDDLAIQSANSGYFSIIGIKDKEYILRLQKDILDFVSGKTDSESKLRYSNLIQGLAVLKTKIPGSTVNTIRDTLARPESPLYGILDIKNQTLGESYTSDKLKNFIKSEYNTASDDDIQDLIEKIELTDKQKESINKILLNWEILSEEQFAALNIDRSIIKNGNLSAVIKYYVNDDGELSNEEKEGFKLETSKQIPIAEVTYDINNIPYAENSPYNNSLYSYYNGYEVLYKDDNLFIKSPVKLSTTINGSESSDISNNKFWKVAKLPAYYDNTFMKLRVLSADDAFKSIKEALGSLYTLNSNNVITGYADSNYNTYNKNNLSSIGIDMSQDIFNLNLWYGFTLWSFDEFKNNQPADADNDHRNGQFITNIPLTEDLYLQKGKEYTLTSTDFTSEGEVNVKLAYYKYLALVKKYVALNPDLKIFVTDNVKPIGINIANERIIISLNNGKVLSIDISNTYTKEDIENPSNWILSEINSYNLYLDNIIQLDYRVKTSDNNWSSFTKKSSTNKTDKSFIHINKSFISDEKIISIGYVEGYRSVEMQVEPGDSDYMDYLSEWDRFYQKSPSNSTDESRHLLILMSKDGGQSFTAFTDVNNNLTSAEKTTLANFKPEVADSYINMNGHLYVIAKNGNDFFNKAIDIDLDKIMNNSFKVELNSIVMNGEVVEDLSTVANKINANNSINGGCCDIGNIDYVVSNNQILFDYYSTSAVHVPTKAQVKEIAADGSYIELFGSITDVPNNIDEAYFSFLTKNDIQNQFDYLPGNFNLQLLSNNSFKIQDVIEVNDYHTADRVYLSRYLLSDEDLLTNKSGYPKVEEDKTKKFYEYDDDGNVLSYNNDYNHEIKLSSQDGKSILYKNNSDVIKLLSTYDILNNHVPYDSLLTSGKLTYVSNDSDFYSAIVDDVATTRFGNRARLKSISNKDYPNAIFELRNARFSVNDYVYISPTPDTSLEMFKDYEEYIVSVDGEWNTKNNVYRSFGQRCSLKPFGKGFALWDEKYGIFPIKNIKYFNCLIKHDFTTKNNPRILFNYTPIIKKGKIINDSDFPVTGIYYNPRGYGGTRNNDNLDWTNDVPWNIDPIAFTDEILTNSRGEYVKLTDERGNAYKTYNSTNIGLEYITSDINDNGNIIHVADITKKQFNSAGYHDVEVYHTNEINKYTFYIPEKTRIRYWVSSKVLTSTPIYVKLFKNKTSHDLTKEIKSENVQFYYTYNNTTKTIKNLLDVNVKEDDYICAISINKNAYEELHEDIINILSKSLCNIKITLDNGSANISNLKLDMNTNNIIIDGTINVISYRNDGLRNSTDNSNSIKIIKDENFDHLTLNADNIIINSKKEDDNNNIYTISYNAPNEYILDNAVTITYNNKDDPKDNKIYNDFILPQFKEEVTYTIGNVKYIGDEIVHDGKPEEQADKVPLTAEMHSNKAGKVINCFDENNSTFRIKNIARNNFVRGLYGTTLCYVPKYNSLNALISSEGYVIKGNEIDKSIYEDCNITSVESNGSSFKINILNDANLNNGKEHYLQFKLLTVSDQNIDIKNMNNPDYFEEVSVNDIELFQPNRQYYNKGYPQPPIKIGAVVYNSENREYYDNSYYINDFGSYIYMCDENGYLIGKRAENNTVINYRLDRNGDGDCSANIYTDYDGRVINLTPKFKSCKDWFKQNYYVEGKEINPLWQIIRIKAEKKNKIWNQTITINKFVKANNTQNLEPIVDNKKYLNIISSIDNDFTSSSISQKKSDYLNTITGTIKFVAYEGGDYYNNLEECELYGLTFKNVMNNWSSKQEKYNFNTTLKANYIVNSVRDMSSSNIDNAIATITELGLFDKDHKLIAYAQFPPIEYNTVKNHAGFTFVVLLGNMTKQKFDNEL